MLYASWSVTPLSPRGVRTMLNHSPFRLAAENLTALFRIADYREQVSKRWRVT